jgi:hypothetical protein
MSKRGRASGMGGQEEYAFANLDAWVGFGSGLGSAGAMAAAAAAGGCSGRGSARAAAANDSDFEAADESEPGSEDFNSSSDEEEQVKPARKKAAHGSGAAPKATPKPHKQAKAKAKAKPKEKKGPRIGAKKAMKIYHLDESDLAKMKDVKRNFNNYAFGECQTVALCRQQSQPRRGCWLAAAARLFVHVLGQALLARLHCAES